MGGSDFSFVIVGVSLIAIAFGDTGALYSAVRSILSRSCAGVRCVVISNLSGSRAIALVGRCRPLLRNHLG